MGLEGAMIIIASISLPVFYPAFAFRGAWKEADTQVCCCARRQYMLETYDEKYIGLGWWDEDLYDP